MNRAAARILRWRTARTAVPAGGCGRNQRAQCSWLRCIGSVRMLRTLSTLAAATMSSAVAGRATSQLLLCSASLPAYLVSADPAVLLLPAGRSRVCLSGQHSLCQCSCRSLCSPKRLLRARASGRPVFVDNADNCVRRSVPVAMHPTGPVSVATMTVSPPHRCEMCHIATRR